jgi:hypothetical protein
MLILCNNLTIAILIHVLCVVFLMLFSCYNLTIAILIHVLCVVFLMLFSCIYMLYNIFFTIAYVAEKQYLCSELLTTKIIAIMKEKLTKNDSMSKSSSEISESFFEDLILSTIYSRLL